MADGQELIEHQDQLLAPATTEFGMLMEATRDKNVDAEKFRMFLDMKREEEDRDAKRSFNRAFVAAKKEIQPIFTNQRNDQTRSNYADSFALADAIDPILSRHGLAATFGTEGSDRDGYYRMVCDLMHEEGHEKRYVADIPIDATGLKGTKNKTDTHAFGSSMSYGRRYLKLIMFDVAVRDDDGQAAGRKPVETIDDAQADFVQSLLEQSGRDKVRFLSYMKIERIEDITAKGFDGVVAMLQKAVAEKAKAEEALA